MTLKELYQISCYTLGIILMKKQYIIIGAVIAAVVLVIIGIIVLRKPKGQFQDTNTIVETNPTPKPIKYTLWKDDFGFSFEYPENAQVNKHDEDELNYAHLEFTQEKHPGNMILWIQDPPKTSKGILVSTVDEWIATQKELKGLNSIDTKLGGQPAKKILINEPKAKIIVVSIYDGLVFLIESDLEDKDYWTEMFNKITTSFEMGPPSARETVSEDTSADSAPEQVVDEEEVVE